MVLEEKAEQRREGWEMPPVIGRQECGSGRGCIQRISAARKTKLQFNEPNAPERRRKKRNMKSLAFHYAPPSSFIDPL
jgi:hypothetical protein